MKVIKNNLALVLAILVVLALPVLWWILRYPYTSTEALNESVLKKTQKTLISEGVIDKDDVLFYADTAFFGDSVSDDYSRTQIFFSFDEDGTDRIFAAYVSAGVKFGRIRMTSFEAKTLNDYSLEVLNGEHGLWSEITYALGVALDTDLSQLKSYPEGNTQLILDRATAASTFADTSTVYDYIYQTTEDKEIFKDPESLAVFFFPHLKESNLERIKFDEREELVRFTANGKDQSIAFWRYRKFAGGKCLYFPANAGRNDFEEALRKHDILGNATVAQLDAADVKYVEDTDKSGYYVICKTKDRSANLYGNYETISGHDIGLVLRIGDKTVPIYTMWFLSRPKSLINGDFDYDGNVEYAFVMKGLADDETLFIVDPGEDSPVSYYSKANDLVTDKEIFVGTHNYIYDGENHTLKSVYERIGLRGKREKELSLDELYLSDYPVATVDFKEDDFRINYDGYDFSFEIAAGDMGYDKTLKLWAPLLYKNGYIRHDSLRVQPEKVTNASSDDEFTYKTHGELRQGVIKRAKEALVLRGVMSKDEELFYEGRDNEGAAFDSEYKYADTLFFVSFYEKGIKNVYVAEYEFEADGSAARINSLNVLTADEYVKTAEADVTKGLIPWGFSSLFETPLNELRADSGDTLDKFINVATADGKLTDHSCVMEYEYEKAADKTLYGDPLRIVKRFFPYLNMDNPERMKLYEETEVVKFGTGETKVISFNLLRGRTDGAVIYIPEEGYLWQYELAVKYSEWMDNITVADLDKAHETYPEWNGFSDGNESPLFVVTGSEDGSAVLYGRFDREYWSAGALQILRVKDRIIPFLTDTDYSWGVNLYSGDFDGDGEEEYAYTRNNGHGTGYYQEALYIVDPGEDNPVSGFESRDLIFGREDVFDRIKYEYEKESGKLTYRLEKDGDRESEGELKIDKDFWNGWEEGASFGDVVFGDIFSITFENGVLGFEASGGMVAEGYSYPSYDYSLVLLGDLVYKDGVITYDNLRLESRVNNSY